MLSATLSGAACSAEGTGEHAPGEPGGVCLAGDACNAGLMCVNGYCVPETQDTADVTEPDGQPPISTCDGRCGLQDANAACQCDSGCVDRSDCCEGMCEVCADDASLAEACAPCEPDCTDLVCGDDGCGGSCGECMGCGGPEPSLCMGSTCIQVCCPTCDAVVCGSDGCGGSCGDCPGCGGPDESLCKAGACEDPCCGSCDGLECGDDGCGASCGTCPGNHVCTEGACVCVPDCSTTVCGPDGCGGVCGDAFACAPIANITSPPDETVYVMGAEVLLTGTVGDPVYDFAELTVTWEIAGDTTLFVGPPEADGSTQTTLTTAWEGVYTIVLRVENPAGLQTTATIVLHVCGGGNIETFDQPITQGQPWKTYGYAFWDPGGWLDMTDNDTWADGAVFNVVDLVNPGNVEIHISICTGGGSPPGMPGMPGFDMGADGYALSVVDVDSVDELEAFINGAQNGGCLAYGVSGGCGSMPLTAFHVEFDTYYNQGNPINDPTTANHIAITLHGDPGNHVLWAEYFLEDLAWHDIVIKTVGTLITVTVDGAEIISGTIPLFEFHGGYIGFSGSTGAGSNYHRVDNLQVVQDCVTP